MKVYHFVSLMTMVSCILLAGGGFVWGAGVVGFLSAPMGYLMMALGAGWNGIMYSTMLRWLGSSEGSK